MPGPVRRVCGPFGWSPSNEWTCEGAHFTRQVGPDSTAGAVHHPLGTLPGRLSHSESLRRLLADAGEPLLDRRTNLLLLGRSAVLGYSRQRVAGMGLVRNWILPLTGQGEGLLRQSFALFGGEIFAHLAVISGTALAKRVVSKTSFVSSC